MSWRGKDEVTWYLTISNWGAPDVVATDSASLFSRCPKRIPYTWGHPCWESQCVSCLDIRRDFVASVIINNTNSGFSCLLISTSSSSISGWVWLYQDFISAVRLRQGHSCSQGGYILSASRLRQEPRLKAGTLWLPKGPRAQGGSSIMMQASRRVHSDPIAGVDWLWIPIVFAIISRKGVKTHLAWSLTNLT